MSASSISLTTIQEAAQRIRGHILHTPTVPSLSLSRATGTNIFLKLENLQAVGSFKERGAANRLALLTAEERKNGVITVSAGNHAQGVARHASLLGIHAVIVMPKFTPSAKVTRTADWGGEVVLYGKDFAEASEHAKELCQREKRVFIHPYDDPAVMAGQGTLGLEFLQDCPESLDYLVLPIGGGGLISGCAVACAALSPKTKIIGVQIESYSPLRHFPEPQVTSPGGATIAEGIAVLRIGEHPYPVIQEKVSDVIVVSEYDVENAITLMAEGAKQITEGAGAASLAAVLKRPKLFKGKNTGLVVSGGNIDTRILANTLLRSMLRDNRLLRLKMAIPDRPGILADIATTISQEGGNVIEVNHQRLFAAPSVQAAELEVMIEARSPAHAQEITQILSRSYKVFHI
ncbi:threonine ammonia-lyase [Entomobacter blattae]|uniref:L-threonine ammonia-lyase n=1 Tax=Entomobacter blattae TaxID=2762277 RepID=A0A7H1NNB4_9PROT|nr:threonine ammonia-lyase [Entomobacter blattae]QNT77274.1 L-threonine ammonia-lyase [Entomobacter blattae]